MAGHRTPPIRPDGEGKLIRQSLLEMGASMIQDADPLKGFDLYVVGFHPGKDDPSMQMEAHHFEILSGALVAPGLPDRADTGPETSQSAAD